MLGGLDSAVYSIAWAPLEDLHGRVIDCSRSGFLRATQISCHAFAELGHACEPHMTTGGSLIAMSYIGAERAIPHYGMMGPIKSALESMVRYMALELGDQKIRVNAVSPGPIVTRAASGLEDFNELVEDAIEFAPLHRGVTIEEVGAVVAMLVGNAGSALTGQIQFVDAGINMEDNYAVIENYTIDELTVGQKRQMVRTVTATDITEFALVSGDDNPAHLDDEFAREMGFKGIVAHGMLGASFISALLGKEFPGPGTIYLGQTLRFQKPVYIADVLTIELEVINVVNEKHKVELNCNVTNQRGDVVITGVATILAPKKKIRYIPKHLPHLSLES
ncbi:unnamed protein product, partial [Darwinula stevensoni]